VNNARARGVQVRYIAEGNNANTALSTLNPAIPVLYRTNSTGSGMHNKFLVADAEDPSRAAVFTGSMNFTTGNMFDDANNIVIIQDQALARTYRTEFEEMWGGTGPQPVPANSRFGADKTDNTAHLFSIGGTPVECHFAPTDHVVTQVRHAIDDTQQTLELALFILTENTLRDAILQAHGRGAWVRGVIDDTGAPGSDFAALLAAGIDVYDHDVFPELLHHKYAIMDRSLPAPQAGVITGSFNWTASANTENDENMLVIRSSEVADQFYQEWSARRGQFTGVNEVRGGAPVVVAPNPFVDEVLAGWMDDLRPDALILRDATGRVVRRWDVPEHTGGMVLDMSSVTPGAYLLQMEGTGPSRGTLVMKVR
jgi:phosphatidylserine/phosphatidylglycerophosphate/cardiolipin synthase-like enzyme